MTDDARTMDFLEGGGTLVYNPQAPPMTAAQIAATAGARKRFEDAQAAAKIAQDAADTYNRNAEYREIRTWTDQDTLRSNHEYVQTHPCTSCGAWNFAGQDYGLLPAAVTIVGSLIATAATGGLAAPSVSAAYKSVKNVRSVKDARKLAAQAQETVDRAQTYFKVPDLRDDDLVAAAHVADDVLKAPNGADIVAQTQLMADTGDVDAQRAVLLLAKVASGRQAAGLGPGQSLLPILTSQQAAIVASVLPQTIGQGRAEHKDWWSRFVEWWNEQ